MWFRLVWNDYLKDAAIQKHKAAGRFSSLEKEIEEVESKNPWAR